MTNRFFLLFGLLCLSASGAFAQQNFLIKDASKTYDVKIKIDSCEDEVCNDRATVYLMKKNQTAIFQTIEMKEMYLRLNEGQKIDSDTIEIKHDQISGFGFADYNFDGTNDLVVSNGYYAPYGGISSDVFLYDKTKSKFARSDSLSKIETENMSVELNKKLRTIETMTKSGCCWHQTTRYKYVGTRLVKIYVFTEDSTRGDGKVRITTERIVGRRWKSTTKVAKMKDYYPEN